MYLRLGEFARAIASYYDAALAIAPKFATSLYGRGLAELDAHKVAAGRADLATAVEIDPGVASRFARMRLVP